MMKRKKQTIQLTKEQNDLITDYYKRYGEKHLVNCINKATKSEVKGEVLNDYIGTAEEALCFAAKNYQYRRGMKFSSWVEINVKSLVKTELRDANTKKRRPEGGIDSLDRSISLNNKSHNVALGDIIPQTEKQENNTYETVVNYMRQLSGDEKIMVFLRCQGADLDDISEAFHKPIDLIKDKFKKMSSYEKMKIFSKRRIIH